MTTPIISLYDGTGDNPLNAFRNDVSWATIEMESPRVELIYASWSNPTSNRPSDHPLHAFTDWQRIQDWAAGFKTFFGETAGYDSSYTGWICFDHWEDYPLAWEWASYLGSSVLQRFRHAARSRYPQICRMTASEAETAYANLYNQAVARIHSEVISQVRSLCPNASLMFYENMRSVFPDDESAAVIEDVNDRVLLWLWEQIDAKTISVYAFHPSVESSPGPGQRLAEDTKAYMDAAATEGKRVADANGLDFFVFAWCRIHQSNALYGLQLIEEADAAMQMQSAYDAGADGVIWWESLNSEQRVTDYNAWISGTLEPAVASLDSGEA